MKACFKVAALLLGGLSAAQGYAGASVHDHNIFHGAGVGYTDTQQFALPVGQSGALRAQLIWKNGGDLDIHAKPPGGAGPYVVTQFELGPQKNPPFGSGNGTANNSHVYWTNRQVQFQNFTATATLDADNRYGVANGPNGERVENMHFDGNLPSGIYQFAVHNYNYQKLADPSADYVVQFTSNGKVGIRDVPLAATTSPMPIVLGSLQSEGQSSPIYTVEIVNPGHDPHAQGVKVVDRKQAYLSYLREQARLAALREAYQKQIVEAAKRVPAPAGGCASGLMIIPCMSPASLQNPVTISPATLSGEYKAEYFGIDAFQEALDYASLGTAVVPGVGDIPGTAIDITNGVISVGRTLKNEAQYVYFNAKGDVDRANKHWQLAEKTSGDVAESTAAVLIPGLNKGMFRVADNLDNVADSVKSVEGVAKRGPKTDPTAPHNAKIREIGDRVEAEDGSIIAGGGRLPERQVPTPGGFKNSRRPDVLYKDANGNLRAVNVGRTKADGSPVPREQKAMQDLNESGLPTTFESYDK